jgi:hypothetical protein
VARDGRSARALPWRPARPLVGLTKSGRSAERRKQRLRGSWRRADVELLAPTAASPTATAFFDVANDFRAPHCRLPRGVACRQGPLEGIWCLDPEEGLARAGEQIERVLAEHDDLSDDAFRAHLDRWLA